MTRVDGDGDWTSQDRYPTELEAVQHHDQIVETLKAIVHTVTISATQLPGQNSGQLGTSTVLTGRPFTHLPVGLSPGSFTQLPGEVWTA